MYPATASGELAGASQLRLTSYEVASPVPLRFTTTVGFASEVLTIVSVPVADPATVGSNCTFKVADWPVVSRSGNTPPVSENPGPAAVARLTVTGKSDEDESVTDCVAGVFKATSPKFTEVALTLS